MQISILRLLPRILSNVCLLGPFNFILEKFFKHVVAGTPSRGGDVMFYLKDINQPSLPTPFYSVPVSFSVFMSFSTYIIQ